MTIRFIKAWGPYEKGECRVDPSPITVHYLCDVYHVAEVVPEVAAVAPKAVEVASRDKMMRRVRVKASGTVVKPETR